MEQLDQLWIYQQADRDVMECENKIRRFPQRQKLVRLRNQVAEQQEHVLKMEKEMEQSLSSLTKASEEHEKNQERLAQLSEEATNVSDIAQVQKVLGQLAQLGDAIRKMERAMQKLAKDAAQADAKYRAILQKMTQARNQYQELKPAYDETLKEQTQELEGLKKLRDEKADGIDEKLMSRYQTIRGQRTPVMAQLNGDQCGGCNMSLPAVVTQGIGRAGRIVECENCGRILYVKSDS